MTTIWKKRSITCVALATPNGLTGALGTHPFTLISVLCFFFLFYLASEIFEITLVVLYSTLISWGNNYSKNGTFTN